MSYWATEQIDGVVVATYSNPPMNYLCAEAAAELAQHIEDWRDPATRVVVLTGEISGRFITHYSVEELIEHAENREDMRRSGTALSDGFHELLFNLNGLPKPVIAAMNGDTMGGGFELSLACDIRILENGDHRVGLPEVKLGILPGGSGTQRLSKLIGTARAAEFILRGRIVDPESALALGLVHELSNNAPARARRIAFELANLPSMALSRAKHAIYGGADAPLRTGLKIESGALLETMLSDDAITAMRAYVAQPYEKRRDWLESDAAYGEYEGL